MISENPREKQSDKASRALGKDLLLLGFSLLLSALFVELLVRHFYPLGETIYTLDRRYLHRHIPDTRQLFRLSQVNGGTKTVVVINKEGRRGDLVSARQPHILVYGDSFIFGGTSPVKDTFVWHLMDGLKGTSSPAPQVINCGVSGYGPDQESLVLTDEIDRLKPVLVIVAIYVGNDFGDLMRDKIYKLDAGGQLQDNAYTLDAGLVNLFAYQNAELPRLFSIRLWQQVWMHFAPAERYIPAAGHPDYVAEWLRQCRNEYTEYITLGNNQVWNLFMDHYDADVSVAPGSESARYKQALMDRVIAKMKATAAARSVPLMLLIIPAAADVVDDYTFSVDPSKYPEYRRAGLTDILEGEARNNHLPYVSLFGPFREHGAASLYYVGDNDHWNAKGQKLAANLVAAYIEREHLLGTGKRNSPPQTR